MPKQKQDDVNKLLTNMKGSAAKARGPEKPRQSSTAPSVKTDLLHRNIDLSPYKVHQGWPGKGYLLVGNSFYVEGKGENKNKRAKRSANIAQLLQQGHGKNHCVSVEEALFHGGFVQSLSRFEFDWLRREAPTSQVGPAYDQQGNLVPGSFAVWRSESAYTYKNQPVHSNNKQTATKQLVGAR
jgi:hypothetical protein